MSKLELLPGVHQCSQENLSAFLNAMGETGGGVQRNDIQGRFQLVFKTGGKFFFTVPPRG